MAFTMKKSALFVLFVHVLHTVHGGVLIWGSESIQLPSLKQFNNEDFDLLKSYMRRPKVVIFKGDPMEISNELQDLLKNKYTAYVPNSNLNFEGVIELNTDAAGNFKLIEDTLNNCSREYDNILAMIVSNKEVAMRAKREAGEPETTTEQPTAAGEEETGGGGGGEMRKYEPVTGAVMYYASAKGEFTMIYSSRMPLLKINATTYNLGAAAVQTVDDRDRGERHRVLSATIPIESGDKVTLRFKFVTNSRGYWALTSVGLVEMNSRTYTLNATADVSAARNFSYHCPGNTLFVDADSEIELLLFDVQAQPDATRVAFDDAYDCVNFTTAPIWSGVFVVSMLLTVLAIGLGALNSIKTMDKFDNSKTKQLTITTLE